MAVEVLRVGNMEIGSRSRELTQAKVEAASPNSERFAFMNKSTIESNWKPKSWFGRFWRDNVAIPFEMKLRQLLVAGERKENSDGK